MTALALRVAGTVAIFAILGTLAIVVLSALAMAAFGALLLQIFIDLTGIAIRTDLAFIAILLFIGFMAVASILPMLATGLVFALFAFGLAWRGIWFAWLAVLIVMVFYLVAGMLIVPAESSPLILPALTDAMQALRLGAGLALPAIAVASLCWLASRPLHRVRFSA